MNKDYVDMVFHKSAEKMDELPDGSVALTVTSPPYWNAIDYDIHSKDPGTNYRTRAYAMGYKEYDEYLGWLSDISKEVFRVTKSGGYYAMVLGTVLLNRRHYPVPFDVASRLSREDWLFHQDFSWHKVTGGVKRAGVFIKNPYPGYYYPNLMTEYIMVFRKPGNSIYSGRSQQELNESRVQTQRLFTNEVANNVWHIAPVPPGHLEHPCPFPEEIPSRLINLYSYPGETVLDPFCGSGQTLKAARASGRHFVGYDVNEVYVVYARKRAFEPPALRKEQLVATYEKIPLDASSPSAGKKMRTRYRRGPK